MMPIIEDQGKANVQCETRAAAVRADDVPCLYPGHRVLAMFPFFNEGPKITRMAQRLHVGLVDMIIGVNDGSTDDGPKILREHGIEVLDQVHAGTGACIRHAVEHARTNGFDILVVLAGNNKDNPEEIPMLLAPIIEGRADYVQGSRFLLGGSSPNLPLFRSIAIRLLSFLFSIYVGEKTTDLTNGFRAYRVCLFDDPRINIYQDWLDKYEYEYYVHWKIFYCGYRVVEVPVTKTYPEDKRIPYSKIRPITGWWRMLRPFIFLALRIKK